MFAKENLMDNITSQRNFWSDDDSLVLRAIREGFLSTQTAMWADQPRWSPTASGLPSTAGTTASVAFIKRGKVFIGHCGDSGIVLGEKDPEFPGRYELRVYKIVCSFSAFPNSNACPMSTFFTLIISLHS